MKIVGIGANYYKPGQERGEVPQHLMMFTKPETSVISGDTFMHPDCSQKVFYEMEIVLKINKKLKNASDEEAYDAFDEVCLGMDWTAKDLQEEAKSKGWPWIFAKGFDGAALLSDWIPIRHFQSIRSLQLTFKVNGQVRLSGNTRDMIASYERILSYTSHFMTLEPGDLVMTGTPHTPGQIYRGDHAEGFIGEEKFLDFKVI